MDRAARMSVLTGHHFSPGQRASFFSVRSLGSFASAWLFLLITSTVPIVLCWRQFAYPLRRPWDRAPAFTTCAYFDPGFIPRWFA